MRSEILAPYKVVNELRERMKAQMKWTINVYTSYRGINIVTNGYQQNIQSRHKSSTARVC
jgi:hypothetical protein